MTDIPSPSLGSGSPGAQKILFPDRVNGARKQRRIKEDFEMPPTRQRAVFSEHGKRKTGKTSAEPEGAVKKPASG
jgi:hypothetical protein